MKIELACLKLHVWLLPLCHLQGAGVYLESFDALPSSFELATLGQLTVWRMLLTDLLYPAKSKIWQASSENTRWYDGFISLINCVWVIVFYQMSRSSFK